MYNSLKSVVGEIKEGKLCPWIYKDFKKIDGLIISPDTDGFVSALFLNEVLGWKVLGFYDGKNFITLSDFDFNSKKENVVFVDVEILRPNIKSVGHHILLYDAQKAHPLITGIEQSCLQPNNWRGKSFNKNEIFATKYPFGTFHLLISIIFYLTPESPALRFEPDKAIIPSIFIDGVFKNLFNYPENCLDWLKYMTNNDAGHPFERLLNHPTTPKDLMCYMRDFFDVLENVWTTKNKRSRGKLNLNKDVDIKSKSLNKKVAQEMIDYLDYLAKQYNYVFKSQLWPVLSSRLNIHVLKKGITMANKREYLDVLDNKKPISFAVTSKARDGLEYTEEMPGLF